MRERGRKPRDQASDSDEVVTPLGSMPFNSSVGRLFKLRGIQLLVSRKGTYYGEEGRTLTRESKSEFTPRGRDLPTFPLLGF